MKHLYSPRDPVDTQSTPFDSNIGVFNIFILFVGSKGGLAKTPENIDEYKISTIRYQAF